MSSLTEARIRAIVRDELEQVAAARRAEWDAGCEARARFNDRLREVVEALFGGLS